MQIYRTSIYLIRITIDIIIIIFAFVISAHLSYSEFDFFRNTNAQFLLLALLITWFFTSKNTDLYDEFRSRNFSFEVIAVIKNIIILVASAMIILFLLREYHLERIFIISFSIMLLFLLTVEKIFFRSIFNYLRKKGRNLRNLIIIGAGEVGKNFYDLTLSNPHFGYNILGFLDDKPKSFLNGHYLGKISDLDSVLINKSVDDVIITLPNYATDKIETVVKTCEKHTIRIRIIPDYFKFISSKYNVSMYGRFPIISVREDRINELHWRILKRSFDFAFTFLLYLFVFSWLWPLIVVIIKLTSQGPVLYKQVRWGRDNKHFVTYKFRSMTTDECWETDEKKDFRQTVKDDPRVTKIGKILRKTSLDELPQFWNVLKGDMSIVTPRPHPTPLNMESKDKVHLYLLRHLVKPGITGWAQVNGHRGETKNIDKMQKRIDHDIWYIENWSFWLDLQIIALTIWGMIKGDPNAY